MESVSCGNCTSVCCKADVVMPLSPEEVKFMETGGTKLESARNSLSGEGYYILRSNCGWLNDDGSCGVYADPGRPKACHDFTAGLGECVFMRLDSGVPTEVPAEILEEIPVFDIDDRAGIATISALSMMALTTF